MSENEPIPTNFNLRCLYCGSGLYVLSEPSNHGGDDPDSLNCDGPLWCNASWDATGVLRTPARFVAFPDMYSRPEEYPA